MTTMYVDVDPGRTCQCNNCDWQGKSEDLQPVADVQDRVEAGCLMPAGECPECGALAYYADNAAPEWTADATLAKLRKALVAFCETVEATGGVRAPHSPVADEEWLDLGLAYMEACQALGREPKVIEVELVACEFCDEAYYSDEIEETTHQQWLCPCCSRWNER